MTIQLYSFEDFDVDISLLASKNPGEGIDDWWAMIKSTDPTMHQARFTKLMSDTYDDNVREAVRELMDNHLIPPLEKEPEVGFNLYYSDVELTSTSNSSPLFTYYGNWQDYKQVALIALPDTAKQFMLIGEDYSYYRGVRPIQ